MALFQVTKSTKISRIIEQAEIQLTGAKNITILGQGLGTAKAVALAEVLKSKLPYITQINKTYIRDSQSVLEIELKLNEI